VRSIHKKKIKRYIVSLIRLKENKEQQRSVALRRLLQDEVVIVTGASSGIGAAIAREFAQYGARVVLAARRANELQTQVDVITGAGYQALAIPTDITEPEQVMRLIEQVQERFGRVDVLVNNAGVGWIRPFYKEARENIDRVINVNLRGAMLATYAVLPGMIARRKGTIISVASVAGILPVSSLYSASKYGLRGFMLSLHHELAGTGVSASLISPGFIRTRMAQGMPTARLIPMPGPQVVARAALDLVLQPRREVIVPDMYVPLVAFANTFPGLLDLALSRFMRRT
jgi:NAD(P)-dependent dehydrogenase (short-subunit alcohol dehydrogenase family)